MPNRERLLEMALKGLEADRAKLDMEISEIRRELGLSRSAAGGAESHGARASGAPVKQKRTMSAEAKRKISESMKRRYAELKRAAARAIKK